MISTATPSQTNTGSESESTNSVTTTGPRGHIGRIVTGTVIGGFVAAVLLVVGPFAGTQEHVITGSVLLAWSVAWAGLAVLSQRWTDQPQRWAWVPAIVMGIAGAAVMTFAPTGNQAGWAWPVVIVVMAASEATQRAMRA